MLKNKLKILELFSLFLLVFIVIRAYFNPAGLPETHDGINHLSRFANYYLAVREGQIPPRIAPALFNHYGYPVFNYNYPLANILSLPFSFLKIHYETIFKIISSSFVFLGAIASYLWLKEVGFKKKASMLGSAAFILSPYLYGLINFRGNIGEIMAMMLLPGLLLAIEKIRSKSTNIFIFSLLFAMFFLSHNVTVLFGIPLLLFYALFRFGRKKEFWKKFAKIFALGILLSLWFWLPAVFEKNQIILDQNNLSKDFLLHFPKFKQLLFSTFQFGFSFPGSIDSQALSLAIFQLATVIFAFIIGLKLLIKQQIKKNYLFFIFFVAACLLIIFQLSFTKNIWLALPMANYIQFPWRLSLFLALPLSFLVAYLSKFSRIKKILIILLALQIIIYLRVGVKSYNHFEKIDYEFYPKSTSSQDENLPKTFLYQDIHDWQASPQIISGSGEIQVKYWKGSDRKYSLNLSEESLIVEPSMYYLGWKSFDESNNQKKVLNYLDNDQVQGRIAYTLPAGEYQIRSQFTQSTWARMLGNCISLFSLFGVIIFYSYTKLISHDK